MSNNMRRAPNVSAYLQNLNSIPTAEDLALQNEFAALPDGSLDLFLNTDFYDVDGDQFNPPNVDYYPKQGVATKGQGAQVNGAPFQFGEFQTYPPSVGNTPPGSAAHLYPQQPNHAGFQNVQAGDKRKAGSVSAGVPSPAELEEQSRMAAEEDKRRRNTAASARFRVKKKQREAALEKQAKEMSDKVSALESKVQELETQNKWLKDLLTAKNGGKPLERMSKEAGERSTGSEPKGVGTDEDAKAEVDTEA